MTSIGLRAWLCRVLLSLACITSLAMPQSADAQVKVSALPAAAALTGAEVVPGVQAGVTSRVTAAQIGAYTLGVAVPTLPAAAALTGAEVTNAVQGGALVKITPAQLGSYVLGAFASRIAPRVRGVPRVAFLGDSLSAFSKGIATNTVYWSNVDYVNYFRWAMRGRMYTDQSLVMAVSGSQSDTLLGTQVPAAITAAPDVAFIMDGTNDIGALTAAQTIANLTAAATALNAAGIPVVFLTITPQNSWSAAFQQKAQEINRRLFLLARDRTRNVRVIDVNAVAVDYATGYAVSGYLFSDGVHEGPVLSSLIGSYVATNTDDLFPKAAELLPSAAADAFDASLNPTGSIITNGLMNGTTGTMANGVTGTVPSYWRAVLTATSTMTAAMSKGTVSGLVNTTIPTMVATFGGTGDSAIFKVSAASNNSSAGVTVPSGLNAGDTVYAECEISWTGMTGFKAIDLRLDGYTSATTYSSLDGAQFNPTGTTALAIPAAFSGLYRTEPLVMPASPIGIGFIIEVTPFSGSTLGGSVAISRCALRKAAQGTVAGL